MRIYEHFPYKGKEQRWVVPTGVTEAQFECWGAAGGMPSGLAFEGKKREVVGGTGPKNDSFFNNPYHLAQLGNSFANNAGYATGIKSVSEGDVYYVYVGGNGGPGHSTIKLKDDGSYEVAFRGGAGGYNGGGDGGKGAHVHQNLYNSTSTKVHYKQAGLPNSAKSGQLWHDTTNDLVKSCNTTYTAGNGTNAKWTQVTHSHSHAAGPSGGGGGGATDIRKGSNDIAHRILVAGGGGGAGGQLNATGPAAWSIRQVPVTPTPPFGGDTTGTGATGPDNTWCTAVNYLVGGWGGGGIGGSSGPKPTPVPTSDGGYATTGDSGGPGTDRHQDGTAPNANHGSQGRGGTSDSGGARGSGGSGGQAGSKGQGGNGADADGNPDDWCAGGGGGGGGYWGGGGGGQGFKVSGTNGEIHTRSGGGGGGSNYVDPAFTQFFVGGCAQPPFAKGNSGTGANGLGGFARITYLLPPKVKWTSVVSATTESAAFDVAFDYAPAQANGKGISHYIVGTATDPSATFPTAETTYMVTDATTTSFTHTFTAPAAGVQNAYFVQVVDLDGDASAWLKQKVTGITAPVPQTITSPAAGSSFETSVTVDWTTGSTQTPLAAYRLGVTGVAVTDKSGTLGATSTTQTGWRRGGSRVNLALDPGFKGSAVWSSTSNAALVTDTTFPGVSGSNGKIAWTEAEDFSAEEHTTTFDNLVPDTTYRLHLGVASALTNDPRPVEVLVYDSNGQVASAVADLSATTAGTYIVLDVEFTPRTQGVYVVVRPSATVPDPALANVVTEDFEAGTITGWSTGTGFTVAADNANPTFIFQGDYGIRITGFNAANAASAKAFTTDLTTAALGAGWYVAQAYGYAAAGGDTDAKIMVSGSGVTGTPSGSTTVRDTPTLIRVPFFWDGAGSVDITLYGNTAVSTGLEYDYITIDKADVSSTAPAYGNTDSGQITYLSDMLVELKYEEDSGGYEAYFDGAHLNGLTGAVSWQGAVNASPSYLTGTDVLTGVLDYSGGPLSGATLYLDTLSAADVVAGHTGVQSSESIEPNPTPPATPTVTLTVNSVAGVMVLSIDAADGAATYKTTSFDIFRNGVRVATGLVPDQTTRLATFTDVPASGEAATYVVRAFTRLTGGWADQPNGTVA